MNIEKWLNKSVGKLEEVAIPTAKLDAEVLLADALQKDRSWIHAHQDFDIEPATIKMLDAQITQRLVHIPLAYIRGKQEFFGREFLVNPDTLTPRPETETMIDIVRELKPKNILDIGTGSGCIGITAKLELPESTVTVTDISEKCLETAKLNSEKLNATVEIVESDLLQDINVKKLMGSLFCCNLPYVPLDFNINTAASHEPKLALYGGEDGLDFYRQLFEQILSLPEQFRPITILTEALPPQHEKLELIAKQAEYKLVETRDLIQHFTAII